VDTGLGLERLAAVLQQVHSNYEIDLFRALIAAAAEATGSRDLESKSLRVIADHIRSCAFLIVDGILPGNEGRGYVLRRIIRRAIRHGYQLGRQAPFFYRLVDALDRQMGEAYPELRAAREHVGHVLRVEEERFAETIAQGMRILEETISSRPGRTISGEMLFKLYDTYGFPLDLTADVAREHGLEIDRQGFERAMQAQRERARAAGNFSITQGLDVALEGKTDFTGYQRLDDTGTVVALFRAGESVEKLTAGEQGLVILDRTPFYAESGGQVGDTGELLAAGMRFCVRDTQKKGDAVFGHSGKLVAGELSVGDRVTAQVDPERRLQIALNHSATHLLHAALRKVLGGHVQQKGSLVEASRLRFDFSHFEPVSRDQLLEIERMVNDRIRENHVVETRIMALEDARASGAQALFGEKYDEQVRVLRMSGFSVELCGGTHVKSTGDIGLCKLTAETGIASGVRRIEAVTGAQAVQAVEDDEQHLLRIAGLLNTTRRGVHDATARLLAHNRQLEKQLAALQSELAVAVGGNLAQQAVEVGGAKILAARLDGVAPKPLRELLDQLKQKLGSSIVLLIAVNDGKVHLVAGVSKDLTHCCKAGDLVRMAAAKVGGKGGGRPDMAQAGGSDPSGVAAALALVHPWAAGQLG